MVATPGREVQTLRGPCVTFLPGRVRCPLAGVGARAADASNRLVIDDPATEVTVDRDAATITIGDERSCATKTVIVDLVWLAEGVSAAGVRVPFTIHLEVTKTGRAYAVDLHTHEPANLPRTALVFEPFSIVTDRGEVLVSQLALGKVASIVRLKDRVSRAFLVTRDHLPRSQDPSAPGYRVVDRSIGIGALGLGLHLVRAKLTSLSAANAPLIRRGDLSEMLREGAWELSLEALTDRWLPELVQRDLVLFEIDRVPLLGGVRARGLRAGQTLGFRCAAGVGEVVLDGAAAPLPEALDVARAYLEFHMLGGMLTEAVRGA